MSSFDLCFVVEFWIVLAFTKCGLFRFFSSSRTPVCLPGAVVAFMQPYILVELQRRFFGRLFLVSTYVETEEFFFFVLASAENCRRFTLLSSYRRVLSFSSSFSTRIILLHFCLSCSILLQTKNFDSTPKLVSAFLSVRPQVTCGQPFGRRFSTKLVINLRGVRCMSILEM